MRRSGERQRAGRARRSDRWRQWGVLVVIALLAMVALASSAAARLPSPVRVAPAPKLPAGAKARGAVRSGTSISGVVALKPRDNAALQRFIANVSDPSSPRYGHYLAAGAFAARFGPTKSSIDAVTSRLKADGLTVNGVAGDGLLVTFTASASRVESAFHTKLENYRLSNGAVRRATTRAIELPSTVSGSVSAVLGLNTLTPPHPEDGPVLGKAGHPGHAAARAAASFSHPAGTPTPCADARSAATDFGGLTDDQIASAYGAFGLYDSGDVGAGQRIAVYELEPFDRPDTETFDRCYFGNAEAASMAQRLTVTPVDGGQPAGPGSGESLLDVEDVSAMAPGAGIDVYEAPNNDFGSVDEYAAIINADQDRVVTTSWGFCEQAIQQQDPGAQQVENNLFEQAAAQGQSVFSAAGDTGSDDCNAFRTPNPAPGQNPLSVDDPGSQPYVVSVGGTTINDADTSPAGEQVWNDGGDGGGGGGGISESWTMPAWQRAARVPGISKPGSADYTNAARVERQFGYPQGFCADTLPSADAADPCRLVPDVSAQADEYTGAVTVYSSSFDEFSPDGWITIGGTSSATPIWAALLADINASATCQANSATAQGVGFVSPLLYAVASTPSAYSASFNDITTGNNDIYGLDNGLVFPARSGFDLASGLGSPRLTDAGGSAGLAANLCSRAVSTTRPTVTDLSPASGSAAGGEQVTITGSGFEQGGKSQVSGVQVGSLRLASSAFRVTGPSTIVATFPAAVDTLPPQPQGQDSAGAVEVIVSLASGRSSAPGPGSTFQYVDTKGFKPVPGISGISPYGGAERAPTAVKLLGSGFTGATRVTFGGVPATSFEVTSPNSITVTPPAYSPATVCKALPDTGVYRGENAANDICQVQVRVTGPGGTSAADPIKPPPEGPIAFSPNGALTPPGCSCEQDPASTEYDYVPTPAVTSISTSAGPGSLASENGGTIVTVHGRGLTYLTWDWTDFGPPGLEASQDTDIVYETGTEIQVVAPPEPLTVTPLAVAFSVKTIAGQSNAVTAEFAGIPTVTSVVNTADRRQLDGFYGGPDIGGTPIEIEGSGFAGQLTGPIQFVDAAGGPAAGTQYTYTITSASSINTRTVAQLPALVDVEVCTVTGCSYDPPADYFLLYPPGRPQVSSVTPASGPAAGGTDTVIGGDNLGCPVVVYFGATVAAYFAPTPTGLDCGSTVEVYAISPPGGAGATVPVRVETFESYFTGTGPSPTTAKFTYTGR